MSLTRYGQITGNYCTAVITFDPDVVPLEEMQGTLGATLLPIQDYLDGQWGVGATYDGLEVRQDVPLTPDAGVMAAQVTILQGQVDDLTGMILADTDASVVQSGLVTTSTTGVATFTWPKPFASPPRISATLRNTTATFGAFAEITAVTATSVSIRSWQLRNVVVSANPALIMANAQVHLIAYGPLAT